MLLCVIGLDLAGRGREEMEEWLIVPLGLTNLEVQLCFLFSPCVCVCVYTIIRFRIVVTCELSHRENI